MRRLRELLNLGGSKKALSNGTGQQVRRKEAAFFDSRLELAVQDAVKSLKGKEADGLPEAQKLFRGALYTALTERLRGYTVEKVLELTEGHDNSDGILCGHRMQCRTYGVPDNLQIYRIVDLVYSAAINNSESNDITLYKNIEFDKEYIDKNKRIFYKDYSGVSRQLSPVVTRLNGETTEVYKF